MDLNNNQTFQIFFVAWLCISIIIAYSVRYFLKKRGVNTDSSKNMLKLILLLLPLVFIPFWLDPTTTIRTKIVCTIIAYVGGIVNYLVVDRAGRKLRKVLGIESADDIRERTEKERKIKERLEKQNKRSK